MTATGMAGALQFVDVGVHYGKRQVVHGVNDTVAPGEWLCLIGPNGAGKSSLLRAILGLAVSSGSICVDGTALRDRSPRQRAALVAYVPQVPQLPEEMSAFDYVLLGRNPGPIP
ncbi:MAG TPA: ABC transporter ATP-binding protein, partial [Ilumatobacteraceae bacterium]|nr:ABC transporter ATP-binding protein [Ilumatobacteraceae bacterium]